MGAASVSGFRRDGAVGALYEDVWLVEGRRTPFGKLSGALSTVSPTDLGIHASRAAIAASGIPAREIDQAIVANIGQASADSFFLPRHIALYSGSRVECPASLAQRICGSGLEILSQAAVEIAIGKAGLVLACGTDSMSRFPLASYGMRRGFALGKPDFVDLLWEALDDTAAVPMGRTADLLAVDLGLSRADVDRFAAESQNRCFAAREAGFFAGEIAAFPKEGTFEGAGLKLRRFRAVDELVDDEHPRRTSPEKLAALPPVFSKEGPTTAGSASGIVDGAAAALVASGDFVKTHGLKPLGRVLGVASVGVDPSRMGIGPVPAIRALLAAKGLDLASIRVFEINEAFAAQCLAVARSLELDPAKVNPRGGAIAIGHPLAATGCRLAITCLRGLRLAGGGLGIASACVGGGQGIALLLETP